MWVEEPIAVMDVTTRPGIFPGELSMITIPFLLQVAWVLAALFHPGHIVSYAPRDYEPHY
jgi:hypothetical protein